MMSAKGQSTRLKYRRDIDGLRAIAVMAVVAFHAFPGFLKGGFVGVDIFFVISGYLISNILMEDFKRGSFRIFDFYLSRIRRIFPALILILISCLVFGWFALLADEYKQLGKHIAGSSVFLSNFIFMREAGYFDNLADTKPLLHLWSLGIEWQFYVVWPLILLLARSSVFGVNFFTVSIAAVSFCLSAFGVYNDSISLFYSPLTRFWEFLCGAFLYSHIYFPHSTELNLKNGVFNRARKLVIGSSERFYEAKISSLVSFCGLLLLIYSFLRIDKESVFPGTLLILPVLGSILIIAAGPGAWINSKILSSRVAVWFGTISYPLYLWHWPLLSFARIVASETPCRSLRLGLVCLSIALAWLTYRFIEKPIRFRWRGNSVVMIIVLCMICTGCLGFAVFVRDGYELRGSIRGFVDNKSELLRAVATDSECFRYIGITKTFFTYCRFLNSGSGETVAVVGDSHAHVAYPPIAEYLKRKGLNTLLLANSKCPPFLGGAPGRIAAKKTDCDQGTKQIVDTLIRNQDIRRIIIFTRGPVYITGKQPATGDAIDDGYVIQGGGFYSSFQVTIDRLVASGKLLYYVTENPELAFSAASCLSRPFNSSANDCGVERAVVLERQSAYLKSIAGLNGVTVIYSLSAFCPDVKCIVFNDSGNFLYSDSDHLSPAGAKFQFDRVILPFLE